MSILISLGIWIAGATLTIILFFAMAATLIFFPFDKQRRIAHRQCFWWADAIIGLNPYWKIKIEGLENIDHKKTYVIVANHQSLGDIVVAYKIRMQFKWVAKESLFKVPFLGWSMPVAKHIKLTRGKFGSIKKVYREAAGWLRSGMSVLFFPEGTRSDTDGMGEFQNGAFKLAIKEKVSILPVSITGTRDAIPKGSWIMKKNVFGKLKVFPAIDAGSFEARDFKRLRDIVYEKLKKEQS